MSEPHYYMLMGHSLDNGWRSFVTVVSRETGETLKTEGREVRIEVDDELLNAFSRLPVHLAALEKRIKALESPEPEAPAETRCEVCSRVVNTGDDVLYCSEDDTVQHTGCSGLTNVRGTPWMG